MKKPQDGSTLLLDEGNRGHFSFLRPTLIERSLNFKLSKDLQLCKLYLYGITIIRLISLLSNYGFLGKLFKYEFCSSEFSNRIFKRLLFTEVLRIKEDDLLINHLFRTIFFSYVRMNISLKFILFIISVECLIWTKREIKAI